MQKIWSPTLRFYIGFTAAAIFTYAIFAYLVPMFLPFIFAWCFVGFILPPCQKMANHFPIKSHYICMISMGLIYLAVFALGSLILYKLCRQITGLTNSYTTYFGNACSFVDKCLCLSEGKCKSLLMGSLTNSISTITSRTCTLLFSSFSYIFGALIGLIASFQLIRDMDTLKKNLHESRLYRKISPILSDIRTAGFAYLKSQCIIITVIAVILSVGFYAIDCPYSIVFGVVIAILDALPAIGSGLFLVPYAVYAVITGQYYTAVILILLYILCLCVREFLEPRLMGKEVGFPPFLMLLSIYLGLQLFGLFGFILGPIYFIVLKGIAQSLSTLTKAEN